MKIWIVKYDDGEQVGECYACGSPISAVEVDIDELSEEWQRDFVNLMGLGNGQVYMQPTKSFSEFLQERMK